MGARQWGKVGAVLLVALGTLALRFEPGAAQTTHLLQACKKFQVRQIPNGSELVSSQCGNRFTTKDAYIGLVVHLDDIDDQPQTIIAELLDPEQQTVWTQRWRLESAGPGGGWARASYSAVLPVAADRTALANESVFLATRAIAVQGKPVIERIGQWTFRARINNAPLQLRFTLSSP